MLKRFVTITAATSMFLTTVAFSDPAAPSGLRVVSQRKTISREIPLEFQDHTDDNCHRAALWLLDELAQTKAACVNVKPSGESPIRGTFCAEDLEEMLEEY